MRSSSTSLAEFDINEFRREDDLISNRVQAMRAHSLKEWVNLLTKNKQGFSALHFASFRGNLKMVKYLLAHEADPFVLNP